MPGPFHLSIGAPRNPARVAHSLLVTGYLPAAQTVAELPQIIGILPWPGSYEVPGEGVNHEKKDRASRTIPI